MKNLSVCQKGVTDKKTSPIHMGSKMTTIYKKVVKAEKRTIKISHKRGNIRVGKLPYRWDPSPGPKTWPVIPGYKNINVCSSARGIFKELSPMYLGPVEDSQTMENFWQFSKVLNSEIDVNGDPGQLFFERRETGFSSPKGIRRKSDKSPVEYFYWKGEKLNLVEARKRIYCYYYELLVVKTDAYKSLEDMLKRGINIQILGYDGHDYDPEDDSSGSQLIEFLQDTSRSFGHEFVLAGLLTNKKVWRAGFETGFPYKKGSLN